MSNMVAGAYILWLILVVYCLMSIHFLLTKGTLIWVQVPTLPKHNPGASLLPSEAGYSKDNPSVPEVRGIGT